MNLDEQRANNESNLQPNIEVDCAASMVAMPTSLPEQATATTLATTSTQEGMNPFEWLAATASTRAHPDSLGDLTPGLPYTRTINVGPVVAQQMLDTYCFVQRPIQETKIKRYVLTMKRGKWLLSPHGISFSTFNALIDGQHRLRAVIDSGLTVQFTVGFNYEHETFRKLDPVGGGRSSKDYVAMYAPEAVEPARVANIGKLMRAGIRSSVPDKLGEKHDRIAIFSVTHLEIIEQFSSVLRGFQGGIVAAFCNAAREDDDKRAGNLGIDNVLELAHRLAANTFTDSDDPLNVLAKYRGSRARYGTQTREHVWYQITLTAIKRAWAGKKMKKVKPAERDFNEQKENGRITK